KGTWDVGRATTRPVPLCIQGWPAKARPDNIGGDDGGRQARTMHHNSYRPCVGIALFNREGLVFIGRRRTRRMPDVSMAGHQWQMPQGGIDLGEQPRAAA